VPPLFRPGWHRTRRLRHRPYRLCRRHEGEGPSGPCDRLRGLGGHIGERSFGPAASSASVSTGGDRTAAIALRRGALSRLGKAVRPRPPSSRQCSRTNVILTPLSCCHAVSARRRKRKSASASRCSILVSPANRMSNLRSGNPLPRAALAIVFFAEGAARSEWRSRMPMAWRLHTPRLRGSGTDAMRSSESPKLLAIALPMIRAARHLPGFRTTTGSTQFCLAFTMHSAFTSSRRLRIMLLLVRCLSRERRKR
jgi:hypothetical protein